MEKEAIEEFHNILDMYVVSLQALKTLEKEYSSFNYECIITQNEFLLKKLIAFGINHVGDMHP